MLKKVRFLLAFMALSICLCLMSSTYSRYVADTTGDIDVLFANWQILVNTTDITNGSSSSITFVPTIEPNANVASNVIAPSSKGYFDIQIDPTNVDVSFKYNINFTVEDANMPDILITKYAFVPTNYIEGDPLETTALTDNTISNTLLYDNNTAQFSFSSFTIRVYFEWYEGTNEAMDDTADTNVGVAAASGTNTSFTVNANISFEQLIN